jgi:NADH-quinone oxidoreductase subunit J
VSPDRVVFLLFAVTACVAGIKVVTSHRIFHAALWMIGTFFAVAAVYLLLESPFMAGIQVFLYIGGVAVLTVIAIMVTKDIMRGDVRTLSDPWASALVSVALFAVMVWMVVQLPLPEVPAYPVPEEGIQMLGAALVDPSGYLLPFEVVSVMLLVVLVGSLYLGKER